MYPVIAISERACLLLHEGRIIGLRILPRNCGEVEARHVPGYRHFGERTLFRIEATRRASSLYHEQHPRPKARARLP